MNSNGHKQLARLVNRQLVNEFPCAMLLEGSVDPDVAKYSSYTGDEAKHHFDDGHLSSGRLHTQDHILRITVRRCREARKQWLDGCYDRAALDFGVMTHYFMDGFICSPSVDEDLHRRGDSSFARALKSLRPLDGQRLPEDGFGLHYVQAQLGKHTTHFGETDPAIIQNAYRVLVCVGLAVTDDEAPLQARILFSLLQERLTDALRWFAEKLESFVAVFQQRLPSAVREAVRGRLAEHGYVACAVGLMHLYNTRRVGLLPPVVATVARAFFRAVLRWRELRPFRTALHEHARSVVSARRIAFRKARRVRADACCRDRWYRPKLVADRCQRSVRQCVRRTRNKAKTLRQNVDARLRCSIQDAEKEWFGRSFAMAWLTSIQGRLGCWCGEAPGRWVALVVCCCALITPFLTWAICRPTIWSLLALALVGVLTLSTGGFLWNCHRASVHLCRRVQVTCPACQAAASVWVLPGEASTACPRCAGNIDLRDVVAGG